MDNIGKVLLVLILDGVNVIICFKLFTEINCIFLAVTPILGQLPKIW